jgi:SPP1 family predicted phage head-tail adaptor
MNATMKMPPLGTLTDRVLLRRSAGEPIATVWARVRQLSAKAYQEADKPTHTVLVRFRTDLSEGSEVVCRGRVMRVVSATDINDRRAYLALSCIEQKAEPASA